MVCSIKSVLPRIDEGVRDILAEQFAGEFAERLVGRAVTAVIDVVFEVIQQLVGGRVTPGGIAREAAMQNVVERAVNARIELAEIGNRPGS